MLWLHHVQGGGFTKAGRYLAELDDGRSVFVKEANDALTAGWLRLEHVVYRSVEGSFLPGFLGYDDEDGLPLLLLEDLSGARWPPPWTPADVAAVKRALEEVAATEAPAGLTPMRVWRDDFRSRWDRVAEDPEPFLSTGVASRDWLDAHLPALRAAADRAPVEEGDSLVHLDVRSDNTALAERGAVFVDWNWASRGNPVLDLVAWAPSLCLEAGVSPEETVEGEGVPELAALVAGVWAHGAGLPPPPTAGPGLREAQTAQLRVALPWAARGLGLPEPG